MEVPPLLVRHPRSKRDGPSSVRLDRNLTLSDALSGALRVVRGDGHVGAANP